MCTSFSLSCQLWEKSKKTGKTQTQEFAEQSSFPKGLLKLLFQAGGGVRGEGTFLTGLCEAGPRARGQGPGQGGPWVPASSLER